MSMFSFEGHLKYVNLIQTSYSLLLYESSPIINYLLLSWFILASMAFLSLFSFFPRRWFSVFEFFAMKRIMSCGNDGNRFSIRVIYLFFIFFFSFHSSSTLSMVWFSLFLPVHLLSFLLFQKLSASLQLILFSTCVVQWNNYYFYSFTTIN